MKEAPARDGWVHELKFDGYRMWQRQVGGDRSVIGRKVNLGTRDNQSSTIVGVLPAELDFPQDVDCSWLLGRLKVNNL